MYAFSFAFTQHVKRQQVLERKKGHNTELRLLMPGVNQFDENRCQFSSHILFAQPDTPRPKTREEGRGKGSKGAAARSNLLSAVVLFPGKRGALDVQVFTGKA
ncbi:hypothetical protein RRG08_008328 [Elysia crispata]|uniref:Uncharacterized protein n=1 Tax=Elysia crispata TaxID=231223 RepID=A0AAE1A8P3_9GAST|nr:hypothetical protein RRG08_008328 [Elysia crispata]